MNTQSKRERHKQLMVGKEPKYVRCYDNGGTSADRYMVVYSHQKDGYTYFRGMSEDPFNPQGVSISDATQAWTDRNKWGFTRPIGCKHPTLGKRIPFSELPDDCKKVVLEDYRQLWRL